MDYYVGIDIGTTATKVVAFSQSGEVLNSVSTNYDIHHPQTDFSEQNPNEIFEAVVSGIKKILEHFSPDVPKLFSFSTAMHSLIMVNNKGELLTPCIIWADNRSAAIAEKLKSTEQGKKFYKATGVPIHSMSPLCKILWLKENEPQVFQQAHKFISIKEYVLFRLFGVFIVDTAIASASGLLNLQTLKWDDTILSFLEISSDKLSEVVATDYLMHFDQFDADFSNLSHVPFVIGSSDGALSNIGAGAVADNVVAVNIGTSSAVRILQNKASVDDDMRTFCYHAAGENYIVGGASNNGAVVLQWLKENLLQTNDTIQQLTEHAEAIPAGADNLILLPFILGERAPIWNAYASGVFFGLSSMHTQAHLVRAVMESIIYSLYSIGKLILQDKNIIEIKASGGFAKSKLWLQILADVFNKKVSVSGAAETTAWGAVVVGLKALGLAPLTSSVDAVIYAPNNTNLDVYQRRFAKYERLYQTLKNEMNLHEG